MAITKQFGLIIYKSLFGLLGLSALITEVVVLTSRGTFNPANFLSFFTVESNILVVISLLSSAVMLARGQANRLAAFRSAVTVYILVVGIGFAVLLSGLPGVAFTAVPWDNIVLHYIMPLAVLADFLLDRPRLSLSRAQAILWLGFPAVYAAYSLIRGSLTGWYPYPFLNPGASGAGGVAVATSGLLVLGLILTCGIHYYSARPPRKPVLSKS